MTKKNETKAAPAAKPAPASKTFAPVKDADGNVAGWVPDHERVDMNDPQGRA
ncbi:MAG: hypothetical protein ACK4JY_03710 [Brevundimonas sp.]|uniref:hypothetical protein n=1 Tax=Brevundimonas sp. TaxID=1871086 RepID=UPI0039199EC2